MACAGIEIVERLGDPQVGVRVVVVGEFFALVTQIRFDLEFGVESEFQPSRSERPNFSSICSSDRYVMWPIIRARRRPRGAATCRAPRSARRGSRDR